MLNICNGNITCNLCNKQFKLTKKRKDWLIGFKSHIKQAHDVTICEYLNLTSERVCKWCKKHPVEVLVTCSDNEVKIIEKNFCDDRNCINDRKVFNPNSTRFVMKCENVSEEEAKKIIHERNSTPFYRLAFKTEEEYKTSQRSFSPRCKEYHERYKGVSAEVARYYVHAFQRTNSKMNLPSRIRLPFHTTRENFIKRYGEVEGEARFARWKSKCLASQDKRIADKKAAVYSLEWYKQIYGDSEGTVSYCHRLNYIKFIETKEYYTLIFKPKELENIIDDLPLANRAYGSSKISNKCFSEVYRLLTEMLNITEYNIWFDALNKEKVILTEKGIRFYDFCIVGKNDPTFRKIVEFDGDYWHLTEKQKTNDILKTEAALKYGYSIFRVCEKHYRKNPTTVVQQIIDFILENKE